MSNTLRGDHTEEYCTILEDEDFLEEENQSEDSDFDVEVDDDNMYGQELGGGSDSEPEDVHLGDIDRHVALVHNVAEEAVAEADDAYYLAEDGAVGEVVALDVPTFDVRNLLVEYLDDEGRFRPMEDLMVVEEPLVERPADPEVEGGCSDNSDVQVDPGLLDEEWLANECNRAAARRSARPLGLRNRGRGYDVWRKGDRLVETYGTDEAIPAELREQWEERVRGSARAMRARGANADDANAELEGERFDDAVPVDRDLLEEFERYAGSDETRFEWRSMASFEGVKELFLVDQPGPTSVFQNAYDAFRAYWDDAALQMIVDYTNAYGDAVPEAERSFHKHWYHTNAHEILMLFAFWMMLGVIKMPSIKSCFSNDSLLKTGVFRLMFIEGRYWSLNRALRFAPNETAEQNPDKLRHISPIITHLNRKFKECYVPSQNISIDESLTLWKGRLAFRQYIKTKAAKYGIKTYELCESATGYLWSFFVYTGKNLATEKSSYFKTAGTVLRLIGPLLGKGYQLFMDNFFNSPVLARFLKSRQTDCVGTVKRTRKYIPPVISAVEPPRGSYVARHADDVVLLGQTDRKPLVMISTHHSDAQVQTRERPGRPSEYKFAAVNDYNFGMGGIDKKDQMLEPYLVERKQCKRWFKKLFKRLLNTSIFNSRILVQKSIGNTRAQLIFRLELVRDILQNHLHLLPKPHTAPVAGRGGVSFPVNRVVCEERRFHHPKKLDQTEHTARQASVRCRWCRDRRGVRTRTAYECTVCKIPLCIIPCFGEFHTKR